MMKFRDFFHKKEKEGKGEKQNPTPTQPIQLTSIQVPAVPAEFKKHDGLVDVLTKKRKKGNFIVRAAEVTLLTFATITAGLSFTEVPYFYFLEKNTDANYVYNQRDKLSRIFNLSQKEIRKQLTPILDEIIDICNLHKMGTVKYSIKYYTEEKDKIKYYLELRLLEQEGIIVTSNVDTLEQLVKNYPFVVVQFSSRHCTACRRAIPLFVESSKQNPGITYIYFSFNRTTTEELNKLDQLTNDKISRIPRFSYFVNGTHRGYTNFASHINNLIKKQ